MKTIKQIKFGSLTVLLSLVLLAAPFASDAQRFNHGGGGGFRGGGGVHLGGGARTINGGGFNIGNHSFRGAEAARGGRGFVFRRNENVFHREGGFGYHPYFYHPYHPYFWGPYWHPFGYFAAALSVDAYLFYLEGQQYYYDNGVYYTPYNGGYTVVAPPVGAVVRSIPAGYETVTLGDDTYYYYGGAFYVSQGGSFRVVPAPVGAVITEIPEGAKEQNINGQNVLLFNNTYYQPIYQNGQDAYEVVQVN